MLYDTLDELRIPEIPSFMGIGSMDTDIINPLAKGLIYEDSLPLAWSVIDALPDDRELENINEANESFLKLLATLEDHHYARQERDESMLEFHHELMRIDLKMDMILEMITQALHCKSIQPKRIDMRLGPEGLEWTCDPLPVRGSLIKLELFLFPRYPRPVELLGKAVKVIGEGAKSKATVSFQGLSVSVQDWLEKIIFRHHRRSIANVRYRRV